MPERLIGTDRKFVEVDLCLFIFLAGLVGVLLLVSIHFNSMRSLPFEAQLHLHVHLSVRRRMAGPYVRPQLIMQEVSRKLRRLRAFR